MYRNIHFVHKSLYNSDLRASNKNDEDKDFAITTAMPNYGNAYIKIV